MGQEFKWSPISTKNENRKGISNKNKKKKKRTKQKYLIFHNYSFNNVKSNRINTAEE